MYTGEEIRENDGQVSAVYFRLTDGQATHAVRPLDDARVYFYCDNDKNVVGVKVFRPV